MTSNPSQRFYTFPDLKRIGWPYSRQHTNRMINKGRFPRPKKAPGGVVNIWTSDQIEDIVESLASTETNNEAA
jgi:predicted DNA-binding transcriptional regulator AlpA